MSFLFETFDVIHPGTSKLKLIRIHRSIGSISITASRTIEIPGKQKPGDLKELITQIARNLSAKGRYRLIIPGTYLYNRILEVGDIPARNLAKAIPFKLEAMLPATLEDLAISYTDKAFCSKGSSVLAFAAAAGIMDQLSQAAIAKGAVIASATPQAIAMQQFNRLVQWDDPDSARLFVDTNNGSVSLLAASAKELFAYRTFLIPDGDTDATEDILLNHVRIFCKSLSRDRREQVKEIYTNIPSDSSLNYRLKEALGLPASSIDDLHSAVKVKLNGAKLSSVYQAISVASLASIPLQSMPADLFITGSSALGGYQMQFIMRAAAVFLAGLLLLPVADSYISLRHQQRRYEQVKNQMLLLFKEKMPNTTRVVNEVEQMRQAVRELKRNQIGYGSESSLSPLQLMHIISSVIDEQIPLEVVDLRIEGNDTFIEGYIDSFENLEAIKKALQTSAHIESVSIEKADVSAKEGNITFRLKLETNG